MAEPKRDGGFIRHVIPFEEGQVPIATLAIRKRHEN